MMCLETFTEPTMLYSTGAIAAAAVGAVSSIGSAIFGSSRAKRAERKAAKKRRQLEGQLRVLENNRQEIINPYEDVGDLSGMIKDLSGMITNPMSSLGVATKSAEIQMEQSDIALANTLDALQATGASAGGATALAQAALQSKQGVAANIEQQEAQNEKLRLEGEQQLQQTKMSEALRVQGALMGEAARMQEVDVKGKEFVYSEKERRETEQLNRIQAQITGQQQSEVAAQQQGTAAITGGLTSLAGVASNAMTVDW